jgi:hypothetical protein
MRHPDMETLALASGGDLGWWRQWRANRHLAQCAECRREVEAFRRAGDTLRQAAELPADLDWDRLAMEMKANIRLGLAAGEIAGALPAPSRRLGWRAAAALAGLTLVVISGFLAGVPFASRSRLPAETGVVAEATPAGIELKGSGGKLTVLGRAGDTVTVSARSSGSVAARYVDSDTGQVTIANVYME